MFGRLPDFDAGEVGFEGIAVRGGWVFVVRCFKAEKWDFQGRDSLYLAVTWMPTEAFGGVDVDALLALPYFHEPMRNPPPQFEFDIVGGSAPFDGLEEGSVLRREIGERLFMRVDLGIRPPETGQQAPSSTMPPSKPVPPKPPPKPDRRTILWWMLVGLLLAIVIVAFAYDVMNRRGGEEDDGSGENLDGAKSAESGEGTNGVSGRTVSHEKPSR